MTFKPLQMPSYHWEKEAVEGFQGLGSNTPASRPFIAPYTLFSQILTVWLIRRRQESIRGSCLKESKYACQFGFFLLSKVNNLEKSKHLPWLSSLYNCHHIIDRMKQQRVSRGSGATFQRVGPALPYYILSLKFYQCHSHLNLKNLHAAVA
jgi:hypothetical protein